MRDKTELNCPNCGAPITGERCEYCGSVFYDWACIDADKPFFIKYKHGNMVRMSKAVLTGITFTEECTPVSLYADNVIYRTVQQPELEIEASFKVVPFSYRGNNVMHIAIDTDVATTPLEELKGQND